MRNLRSFFRPDFERVLTAAASLQPVEEQLRALTEEQYTFLDTADYNDRCILVGPAGSGKTTLALEYARRLSASNKSVLLACYNRLLGEWLEKRAKSFGPGRVVAGSMHAILAQWIDASSFAQEFRRHRDHPDLFSELYPLYGAMAVEELQEKFDAVLIDEAQDFRAETLAALSETCTRGVEGAKVLLFGDYTHQAIYGTPQESLDTARALLNSPAVVPLRRNCRNTRRIAVHTSHLSGFRGLQLSHGQPDGDAVDCWFYGSPQDQAKRLALILSRLSREGFAPGDVVILGKYRIENSAVRLLSIGLPWKIAAASHLTDSRDTIAYSTIHAFKGLEAPVVVIVDVDDLAEGEAEALLYVGMSRARLRLYMLIDDRCRRDFDRKIADGLKELVSE